MRYFLVTILMITSACSGSEQSEKLQITGKVDNIEEGTVTLQPLMTEEQEPIAEARVVDGEFTISLPERAEPGFYLLNINNIQNIQLVLEEDQVFTVQAEGVNGGTVQFEGSDDLAFLNKANTLNKSFESQVMSLNDIFMENRQNPEVIDSLRNEFMALESNFSNEMKSLIRNHEELDLALVYGLQGLNRDQHFQFIDSVGQLLVSEYPEVGLIQQMGEELEASRQVALGSMAPEIALPTPDGDTVRLSDFRGQYVMIDFWAGWCGPCRQENPNLVRAYKKYHPEGFQILGVSLDRTRDAWLKAIKADNLSWPQISDLAYFNSRAAEKYQVNAIPHSVLVDPEGKIVEKNLRGARLEEKLAEIYGL